MDACCCCFLKPLPVFTFLPSTLMNDLFSGLRRVMVPESAVRAVMYILAEVYSLYCLCEIPLRRWAAIIRLDVRIFLANQTNADKFHDLQDFVDRIQ